MAITLIRKPGADGKELNMTFSTKFVPIPEKDRDKFEGREQMLVCETCLADDNLQPLGQKGKFQVDEKEDVFHTEIRVMAAEKKQLVTSHSTDPEWNPKDYTRNLEDESSQE